MEIIFCSCRIITFAVIKIKLLLGIKRKYFHRLQRAFWGVNPNLLWAIKVTLSIAILVVPAVLMAQPFVAGTLGLGVVAMALTETEVHPRARLRTLLIALLSFAFVSSMTSVFRPFPLLFALGLGATTFILSVLGGVSTRNQGITSGSILIIIYTMLGTREGDAWYLQPALYVIGGVVYASISLFILYLNPRRLLQERLVDGFESLSDYILMKSKLFPSKEEDLERLRNELAQQNIKVAEKIEQIKNDLYGFAYESSSASLSKLDGYFRKWYLLQELHERAASSHERYSILSKETNSHEIIEGLGLALREISYEVKTYAKSLLRREPYKASLSLRWTVSALGKLLQIQGENNRGTMLSMLFSNISGMQDAITSRGRAMKGEEIRNSYRDKKAPTTSLKTLLTFNNARFFFSLRLSICLVVGYALVYFFKIEKGDWILLTSFIVFQPTYSATRLKLSHRVLGTIIGVVIGVVLAHLLPTTAGQLLLLLGSIFAFFLWVRENYTVAVVFITVFVLASFNLLSNSGIMVMLPRLADTLIGAALAYIGVRVFWIDWQYKHLPNLLITATEKNKRYFESIYAKRIASHEYSHNRRTAHKADNALTEAWKGMRLEPKSKRKFQKKAYNFTYLNHALISYISAFGVHYFNKDLSEKEVVYCQRISQVLQDIYDLWESSDVQYRYKMQKAEALTAELYQLKQQKQNNNLTLIYNIARVSKELLYEASKM